MQITALALALCAAQAAAHAAESAMPVRILNETPYPPGIAPVR